MGEAFGWEMGGSPQSRIAFSLETPQPASGAAAQALSEGKIEEKFRSIDVPSYAKACGVDEDLLRRTARRIGAAGSVSVYEDLGMQMSVHSTLGSYLQRLIWLTTGNFGRKGMYPFPLADEILKTPLDIQNGILSVPKGPGLGIEVNEDVIRKYPWIPGPWAFFKIHSPPETIAVTGDHSVKWVEAK